MSAYVMPEPAILLSRESSATAKVRALTVAKEVMHSTLDYSSRRHGNRLPLEGTFAYGDGARAAVIFRTPGTDLFHRFYIDEKAEPGAPDATRADVQFWPFSISPYCQGYAFFEEYRTPIEASVSMEGMGAKGIVIMMLEKAYEIHLEAELAAYERRKELLSDGAYYVGDGQVGGDEQGVFDFSELPETHDEEFSDAEIWDSDHHKAAIASLAAFKALGLFG